MDQPALPAGERDARLDGLRGIAILLVMLFHYVPLANPDSVFGDALLSAALMGWLGVDLFFVLSGFLITRLLMQHRDSPNRAAVFYARRALRILPLFFVLMFAHDVMMPAIPALSAVRDAAILRPYEPAKPWYWLFASNMWLARHGWTTSLLDLTWSLAIEEHFYLLWPWVVWRIRKDALPRVCLAIMVGAVAMRWCLLAAGGPAIAAYVLTPARADALAVGALLAAAPQLPWRRLLLPAAATLLAIVLASRFLWVVPGPGRAYYALHPLMALAGYTASAAFFAAVVAVVATGRPQGSLCRLLSWRVLVFTGRISYALYLLHLMALAIATAALPVSGHVVRITFAVMLAYTGATTSWFLLERPILSLKRFLPHSRQQNS